ncbi:MAG TPA: DUF433 domain-containing protein [Rhizomicrobium sp.]|nr:DUF433 domain-containing protein [Rhizomicrobium sp.]
MSDRNLVQTFSEEMASRLTGVTVHQLRYWDKDGFFSPSLGYHDRKVAFSRLYSFRDIVALKVLNRLRNEADCSLQHLREVKDKLRTLGEPLWADTTLYVHNKRVVFINPKTEKLEEVLSGQHVMQIALRVESDNVKKAIQALYGRPKSAIGKFEKTRNVASSQLVIAGTRIPVANVKAFADAGYTVAQIQAEYPSLTLKDIRAAIKAKAA